MDATRGRQRLNFPSPVAAILGEGGAMRFAVPLAPAIAMVLAALGGLMFLLMPTAVLEDLVVDSGIASLITAAQPPLGMTAHFAIAFLVALIVGSVSWFGLFLLIGTRVVAIGRHAREDGVPILRRADAHPDAPPRRPVFANRDLGTPFLEVTAESSLPMSVADAVAYAPPVVEERDIPADLDTPLATYRSPLDPPLPVPDQIVVHGFLTNEGKKISKSSGDAADPIEYVDALGVDAVRHFLLRHVRPFEDSDFSRARLEAAYDADLAHGIGNLTSRLTALCESAGASAIKVDEVQLSPPGYHEALESFRFDLALTTLWDEVARLNRELGVLRPWEDVKHGRFAEARASLEPLVTRLDSVAYWLSPFLPRAAERIRGALAATPIRRAAPLFPSRAQPEVRASA